jgi:hypothetical protein
MLRSKVKTDGPTMLSLLLSTHRRLFFSHFHKEGSALCGQAIRFWWNSILPFNFEEFCRNRNNLFLVLDVEYRVMTIFYV